MKNLLTRSRNLAVVMLLGWCGCVGARSLGMPAVDAWLGQPLQMTVPARFAGPGADDECVHADVFYGDVRLQPERVRATVMGPAQQREVHIEASPPVDEPVVTVSLRAGCTSSITRNYTLLPELPSQAMLASAAAQGVPAGVRLG